MKPTKEDFLKAVAKSIEHHTDGMTRTEDDYWNFPMGCNHCELCHLFGSSYIDESTCKDCALYQVDKDKCAEEYCEADYAKDLKNYPNFVKAETVLVKRLTGMLSSDFYDEFYGKEVKAEVPDFAKFVHRKEGHYYYYMGVYISNLYILTYNIPAKRTVIFVAPSEISDFLSGYMFGTLREKYYPPCGSNSNINTIKEQFATYCKSLERNSK